MPLITAEQTFALCAIVMVIVAFGLWAERQSCGQKVGGPLLLPAISMVAANLNVIAPGILVGLFGYAIATFIGVALTVVLN